MRLRDYGFYFIVVCLLTILFVPDLQAQNLLNKRISISLEQEPLDEALSAISREGDFYFSYNSRLLPADSLVHVDAHNARVRDVIRSILGYHLELKESGNYIIIGQGMGRTVTLAGYISNAATGQKIPNASVFIQNQFKTTLTDANGYFHLRFKNRFPDMQIGVSRAGFKDTLFRMYPQDNPDMHIPLMPMRSITLPEVDVVASKLDTMWLSRLFVSSRQKIRDINLGGFFVRQPFQYSVWPGIGTHGKMSAQSVNKFSFNILGGYAAGVNGFELGGFFNMNKDNVSRSLQIAGLFNVVGGDVSGVQIAGFYNNVGGRVNGLQIAGLVNKTRHFDGLQIGMINISDSSNGYSLGLVNIVKTEGYYKLAVSYNESQRVRLAFKSGQKKFYNMVFASGGLNRTSRVFSIGYGLGREFDLNQRVSLTAEASGEAFVVGYREDSPVLARLQPALHWKLSDRVAVFAGPALSLYFLGRSVPAHSDTDPMLPERVVDISSKVKAWPGFQVGIQLF